MCQKLTKELQDLVAQAERVQARVELGRSKLATAVAGANANVKNDTATQPLPIKNEPFIKDKPQILLLRLSATELPFFEEMAASFMQVLQNAADVKTATTPPEASRLLSSVSAVFVADAGIVEKKNLSLLKSLVDFAKGGGRVIFGGLFSSFIKPSELNSLLATNWQLPWKAGDYTRAVFNANTAVKIPLPGIPESYSMKALHLDRVELDQRVYLRSQSSKQAPATIASVGTGVMGYIGDVNMEQETTALILAMLGLNGH